ncbi:SAC3/GANP/Nin1/mts3/eIF-3 p25, partial [Irpex rosettiformis]
YQRAAGDRVIPSDLRPPPILKKTLDYFFHTLLPSAPFPATAFFIRDRSRAVRNDFTIQYETGPLAVECHERCARFHAVSMHLMVGQVDFDLSMEVAGLKNTLQSLKEFYDDRQGDFPMPHELEMHIYHRLIHIRDTKPEVLPQHNSSNPVFQLVTKFRSQVQVASPVITRKSELKVDEKAMEVFREMVVALKERSRRVMYLVACIMEGVFGQGVVDAVEEIKGDLTIQDIIDG